MTEGRFEKGRWVEEQEEVTSSTDNEESLEKRVNAARTSFGKGLDDLLSVSRDLLTTDEGRKHIGKRMDKASNEIMVTLEDAANKATEFITGLLEQKRK